MSLKENITNLQKAPFSIRLIVLLISGIALSFSQAPYVWWFLIFPCFSILYFLQVKTSKTYQVFLSVFVFAMGYFVVGLYWIGNALLIEGNEYKWAWPLAVIALPALLSLFPTVFLTIAKKINPKADMFGFIGFCAFLALSEWVRGVAFTGFPWNLYGYTWIGLLPVAQSVNVIGSYGLTFFTILWGSSLGFLFLKAPPRHDLIVMAVTFTTLAAFYSYGTYRLNHSEDNFYDDVNVQLVQPNIPQAEKWKSENLTKNFESHIALSKADDQKKTIVIWPETAISPALLNNAAANQRIYSTLGSDDILLAGALSVEQSFNAGEPVYRNSLILWQKGRLAQRLYSKSHLVPFGEYVPFQKYVPLAPVAQFSGFEKGSGSKTVGISGFPSFSPLICYEIIFPQKAVSSEDKRPDYILTITNDGWYGDSAGPRQHFAQARFRAIEYGTPVVRAANTGISGVIDAYGRVIDKIDLMTSGVLNTPLPRSLNKPTSYAKWRDIIFLAIIAFSVTLVFAKRK